MNWSSNELYQEAPAILMLLQAFFTKFDRNDEPQSDKSLPSLLPDDRINVKLLD